MSKPRDPIYKCFEVIGTQFWCKNCASKLKKRNRGNCATLKTHIATQKCIDAGDHTVFLNNPKAAPRRGVMRKIRQAKEQYEAETGQIVVSSDSSSSSDDDNQNHEKAESTSSVLIKQEPKVELATTSSVQEKENSTLQAVVTSSPESSTPLTPLLENVHGATTSAFHQLESPPAVLPTDNESQTESPEMGAAFERAEANLEEVTEGLSDILARLQALQK